ncbi:MAG TPA: MerR family transcriptional regulator [Acidimicrobiales bacterium]|nr:MerR family transcriptional regulator [Acidimicrobiales bacterium]
MLHSSVILNQAGGAVPPDHHGSQRFTVDELARAAGTTTRQVRALQTRGLLARPGLVGRTGYYDAGHLDRLRAVLRLQADGFSLAALATLLQAWDAGMTLAQVLGLRPPPGAAPEHESDDFGDLAGTAGWSSTRRGRLLSLVPTTILDQPAAS